MSKNNWVVKNALMASALTCIIVAGCGSSGNSSPKPEAGPVAKGTPVVEGAPVVEGTPVDGSDSDIEVTPKLQIETKSSSENRYNEVKMGQGYDVISGKYTENCVDLGPMVTQSGTDAATGGQIIEYSMQEATSETELRKALTVIPVSSTNVLLGKTDGRTEFLDSVSKNSESKYLLISAKVANQLEAASSFKFKPEIEILLNEKRYQEFDQKCGNHFVYGRKMGSEFFAVLEFEMKTAEESKTFSNVTAKNTKGKKNAEDLKYILERFQNYKLVRMKMLKSGGDDEFPTIETVSDFAIKFATIANEAKGRFVNLVPIMKDYTGVQPLTSSSATSPSDMQLYALNETTESRDNAKELVNTINYISKNKEMYDVNGIDFTELLNTATSYLGVVNKIAVDCVSEGKCEFPPKKLSIKLPKRKAL